jgi:hypothetical protein
VSCGKGSAGGKLAKVEEKQALRVYILHSRSTASLSFILARNGRALFLANLVSDAGYCVTAGIDPAKAHPDHWGHGNI